MGSGRGQAVPLVKTNTSDTASLLQTTKLWAYIFFFLEKFSFGKGNKDPEHAIRFVHDGKTQELVARNDEGKQEPGDVRMTLLSHSPPKPGPGDEMKEEGEGGRSPTWGHKATPSVFHLCRESHCPSLAHARAHTLMATPRRGELRTTQEDLSPRFPVCTWT